jgi:hypothetical protein
MHMKEKRTVQGVVMQVLLRYFVFLYVLVLRRLNSN